MLTIRLESVWELERKRKVDSVRVNVNPTITIKSSTANTALIMYTWQLVLQNDSFSADAGSQCALGKLCNCASQCMERMLPSALNRLQIEDRALNTAQTNCAQTEMSLCNTHTQT